MSRLSVLLFLLVSFSAQAEPLVPTYYGAKHQQASFSFETTLLIPSSKGTVTEKLATSEFKAYARYMLGMMRRSESPSALYPKYSVKLLGSNVVNSKFNGAYVQISAMGVFAPGQRSYTLFVPKYTAGLYQKANGLCQNGKSGVEESNFWYHWDPKSEGCPLVEDTDYSRIAVNLAFLPNTAETYPEYERLIRDYNGAPGLTMSIFHGLANYDSTDWNPDTNTSDWGGISYLRDRDFLINRMGFRSYIWTESQVREWYNPEAGRPLPRVETFSKSTPRGQIAIRMLLAETGVYHDSKAFHVFLRDSLANDSLMFYLGHSGIGMNLDWSRIESQRGFKLRINPGYQIFYLGSCVPYSYYTDMYFQKKISGEDPTGTKNLDIIAYGNESLFGTGDEQRLIRAVVDYMKGGDRATYQEIVGEDTDFYLGVSGDEDNPTQ